MPSGASMPLRSVLSPTVLKVEAGSHQSPDSSAMEWHTARASQVLKALVRIGWRVARQKGSHRILAKAGRPLYTFAFHDREEIGPRMLARIAKHTGLTPKDL
jgi:predicted RNA binding protein YcfA (HicA-like mRNA interferase family)